MVVKAEPPRTMGASLAGRPASTTARTRGRSGTVRGGARGGSGAGRGGRQGWGRRVAVAGGGRGCAPRAPPRAGAGGAQEDSAGSGASYERGRARVGCGAEIESSLGARGGGIAREV